jgi:hypothetical protein
MKRFLCIFLALGLVAGGAGQIKADYIFTTLQGDYAHGINDSGQIVGGIAGNSGFLYSGGGYTVINPTITNASAAYGINNLGQIVGAYSYPFCEPTAALADRRRGRGR